MQATLIADDLLTVRQVAEMFHLGEKSIRDRILAGRLPAQKLEGGKQWLIRREDALGALRQTPHHNRDSPAFPPLIIPAGTDPMRVEPNSSIIRRTHTPEGRARALAALDALQDGDEEEQRRAGEYLQRADRQYPVQFRRWNVETWERLDDSTDSQTDNGADAS